MNAIIYVVDTLLSLALFVVLARLLLHQRDAVGAVVLNDKRPLFVPPKQNAAHLRAVLSCLQAAEVGGGGCLGTQIRAVIPRLRRRGLLSFGHAADMRRLVVHVFFS